MQVTPPFVKEAVTVTNPEIGAAEVFVAVNEGTFPLPEAPKPIDVLLLVQE